MNKKFKQNYLMPLVPFALFSGKLEKEWDSGSKFSSFVKGKTNALVTAVSAAALIFYTTAAIMYETIDYREWNSIAYQKSVVKHNNFERKVIDEFNTADLDKNGVLDSAEFRSLYVNPYRK